MITPPADFPGYKAAIRGAIRDVLAEAGPGRLDEAAFPAYTHRNRLINWLFWQRLRVAMRFIASQSPCGATLDFGCGSGVMLPFLARHSRSVVGIDVDLLPFTMMSRRLAFPDTVEVREASRSPLESLATGAFDLVMALDVLEHVSDLPATLGHLVRILAPGGCLLVSGPTENVFYKIGRRLAGPEYSGAYHERGIGEVRRLLTRLVPVETVARLYPPVTLFDIFAGIKPAVTRA